MPTQLERELRDQGPALARRAEAGGEEVRRAAEIMGREDVDYLLIAARGSSANAARYAQYLLGVEAGVSVALAAPWLFGHGQRPPRLGRAAVLAISQSGRSPDVAGVLAAARAQRRPTIAITNAPSSPVAQWADVIVDLRVGPERSVAATKTYTASLHALVQIAAALRPRRDWEPWLGRLPDIVASQIEEQLEGRERFDRVAEFTALTAIGRGLDYSTACETALKIRELTGRPAEAFSPADLMHGPVAAVGSDTALWALNSGGAKSDDGLRLLRDLSDRAGLTIATSADPGVLALADIGNRLPAALPDWASSIVAVVPGQAAALRLAELAGVEIDSPHGLHKVTLTR